MAVVASLVQKLKIIESASGNVSLNQMNVTFVTFCTSYWTEFIDNPLFYHSKRRIHASN